MDPDLSNLAGFEFLEGLDWSSPDGNQNGLRVWSARCRVPFGTRDATLPAMPAGQLQARGGRIFLHHGDAQRDAHEDGDGMATDGPMRISGPTSSTSVDWYGTEMSRGALEMMADQFRASPGVPLLPRHNYGWSGPVEWDEVIGRSVGAEVVTAAEVANAYDSSEQQYLLNVEFDLYAEEKAAQGLVRRLEREEPIGLSIGGWFTELRIVVNDDDLVERVIVEGVELDHDAVTRAPANPDSLPLAVVRSALNRSILDGRLRPQLSTLAQGAEVLIRSAWVQPLQEMIAADPQNRHVLSVTDHDDGTVSVRYEIGELPPSDDDADDTDDMGDDEDRSQDTAPAERGTPPLEVRGEALGALLSEAVDAMVEADDDMSRSDVVAALADAAGISASTVNQILSGSINCPPLERLEAFAEVLDVSVSQMVSAAEEDGCTYDLSRSGGCGCANQRDAAPDPTPAAVQPSSSSEEIAMNDELLQALSGLLDEKLEPITTRLDEVERRLGDVETRSAAPAPAPAPAPAERGAPAQESTTEAQLRELIDQRDRALIQAYSRGSGRTGRSIPMRVPNNRQAGGVYEGMIAEVERDCPATAAIARNLVPLVTRDRRGTTADQRSRSQFELEDGLRSLLNAAEEEGLITNPFESLGNW